LCIGTSATMSTEGDRENRRQTVAGVLEPHDRGIVTPLLPNSIDTDDELSDIQPGYLTLDEPDLWSVEYLDNLPDSSFRETRREGRVLKNEYEKYNPQSLYGALEPDRELDQSQLAIAVVKQMGLAQTDYATEPAEFITKRTGDRYQNSPAR
jgi:hypothetical protein